MNWNESFGKEHMPTNEEVLQFLEKAEDVLKLIEIRMKTG